MPAAAKETLAQLGRGTVELDTQLAVTRPALACRHKVSPVSQRLAEVPGVGPITALTVATTTGPSRFKSARQFAAWLRLTSRRTFDRWQTTA